jgi:hypothetical protein
MLIFCLELVKCKQQWLLLPQGENQIMFILRFAFVIRWVWIIYTLVIYNAVYRSCSAKNTQKIISTVQCTKVHTLHNFIGSSIKPWMYEHPAASVDKNANGRRRDVVHLFCKGILYFNMS